jgi:transposase InsO family protein
MMRDDFPIARSTAERLMRKMGLHGVIRGKPERTTISDNPRAIQFFTAAPQQFSQLFVKRLPRREIKLDQTELRYQALQCHVRAQQAANGDDAEWFRDLSIKLSRMADAQESRAIFHASRALKNAD